MPTSRRPSATPISLIGVGAKRTLQRTLTLAGVRRLAATRALPDLEASEPLAVRRCLHELYGLLENVLGRIEERDVA